MIMMWAFTSRRRSAQWSALSAAAIYRIWLSTRAGSKQYAINILWKRTVSLSIGTTMLPWRWQTLCSAVREHRGRWPITKRLWEYLVTIARTTSFTDIENELQISRTTIRRAFLDEVQKLPTIPTMETPSIWGIDEICLMKDDYHRKQPWPVIANGDENTVMELLCDRSKPTIINLLKPTKRWDYHYGYVGGV